MITGLGPAQALLILQGLKWTLLLSLVAFVGGGIGGLVVALCRASDNRVPRLVATGFIEAFRGTPLLLQLFMIYYGLALLDFPLDPWLAVAVGFTLNASAFLGEIWRGCIQAVPRGQSEAAYALGLHRWPGECQKPGALCRELGSLLAEAEAPVEHRGPDLEHSVGAERRPAHLPALAHARVHEVVDRALGA